MFQMGNDHERMKEHVWSLLMFAIFTQNNVSSFAIVVPQLTAIVISKSWWGFMVHDFNLLEVHIEMVVCLLKTQYVLTMSFNAMPMISPIWIHCVVQGHNELGRCLPSVEI
jgi:hypothetical protein